MADTAIEITAGSGTNVDTRTEATNGNHRQVVVLGDPSTNAGVAPVDATAGLKVDLGSDNDVTVTGTVTANAGSGTMTVQLDPGHTIGSVILGAGSASIGTLGANSGVDIGDVTLTAGAASIGTLGANSGVDIGDVTINNSTGGSAVNIQDGGNTITVDGTLTGITGSIAVYFDRANPTVTETNSSTISTNIATIAGDTTAIETAVQIMDDWDESDRAKANIIVGQAGVAAGSGVTGATTQRVVMATDVAGSVQIVAGSANIGLVNVGSTAGIFTFSGTTSTAGNNTIIAASASYNFKVFAYSIQTTGIVSIAPRFTTGASAGATELWRPLITAASATSSPVGANLAVSAPSYIFATGTSATLSLYLDAATLVHYSVSLIKESA